MLHILMWYCWFSVQRVGERPKIRLNQKTTPIQLFGRNLGSQQEMAMLECNFNIYIYT